MNSGIALRSLPIKKIHDLAFENVIIGPVDTVPVLCNSAGIDIIYTLKYSL